uniref:NB-ARC domain-containing protein n=1 Tax=Oryza barthii TaxID=65489 RepID=A0A0D3EWE3_9ORYZ
MEGVSGLVDTGVALFNQLYSSYLKLTKEFADSIEFIQKELRFIKGAINNYSVTADQDNIISIWIADLRDIKERIDDWVDHYYWKVASEQEPSLFLRDLKTSPARKKLVDEIDHIKTLVTEAKGRVDRYLTLHSTLQDGQTSGVLTKKPHRHAPEADPNGLEGPKAELLEMLAKGDGKTKQQLRVIAISGMGGSGKTVLAKALYEQVKEQFECKAWVSASNDIDKLLGDIIDELKVPSSSTTKDLSEQTTDWWRDIEYACPDDNVSSRIIVTTTYEKIARTCQSNCRVYRMQPLDKCHALNLLTRKAFGGDACPSNISSGLDKILEMCEYLPLALVNMATYIKSAEEWNIDKCEEACKNFHSLLVRRIIRRTESCTYPKLQESKSSYHDLLVVSTYPKDHVIKRKSLIRRWLAERLIVVTDGQAEEVANECFADLIDHNIILPIDVGISGQVKTFRVHRMMLEFIKHRAQSEKFVTWIYVHNDVRGIEYGQRINRLYLHNNSSKPPKQGKKDGLSYVRSLTFSGRASKVLMDFRNYTYLRVLELENCSNLQDIDLETICKSELLRYISIRNNEGVTKLPPKIVNLKRLETLDTRGTKVRILPMQVLELPQLINLLGQFQITGKNNDFNNGQKFFSKNTCRLQTLAGFFIDESPGFVKILPLMPTLSKVKISCRSSAPSSTDTDDLLVFLKDYFKKGTSELKVPLLSLSIDFVTFGSLDFLHKLEAPMSSISMSSTFPQATRQLDQIPIVHSLKRLQYLQYLKLIEDAFELPAEGFIWQGEDFVNLKRLCFVVPELPNIVVEQKAMPRLESLQLFCRLGAISGIEHLLRLEEVIVTSNFCGDQPVKYLKGQVEAHPTRPKFVVKKSQSPSPPSSRHVLTRSTRIQRTNERSD